MKFLILFLDIVETSARCQKATFFPNISKSVVLIFSGVVTLCAPRARARAVFGPDKCKDLCGHGQFLLRNVPEKAGARPVSKT